MNISRAEPEFRPVTIELETQNDLDRFLAILDQVAENRINHPPPVQRAAIDIRRAILDRINAD